MSKKAVTDPRVERTRTALVDTFIALSIKRRLTSIFVKDVAAKTKVNRATFYAHFPDKTSLLNYMVRAHVREQLRKHLPAGSTLTIQTIKRLVVAVCNALTMVGPQCQKLHGAVEAAAVGRPMRATIAT